MKLLEKPVELTQAIFSGFMVHTHAHSLSLWCETLDKNHFRRDIKQEFVRMRNSVNSFINMLKIHNCKETENAFYEIGDEFQSIMRYIKDQNDNKNVAGAWSLFQVCKIMSDDNIEEMERFHRDFGLYISQIKFKK